MLMISVVYEAVDEGRRAGRVWEDCRPGGERQVRGDDDALPLVPARDDLEEQVGVRLS
jgi:hypothetical protein